MSSSASGSRNSSRLAFDHLLVGVFGEIATMAHRPAIEKVDEFCLTVGCDVRAAKKGRHNFVAYTELDQAIEAVLKAARKSKEQASATVATPQAVTLQIAEMLIAAGIPTMVEKPPGNPVRLDRLANDARRKRVTLLTGYHSAACPGMKHILQWFADNKDAGFSDISFVWKESAAKWHRGQDWVTKREGAAVMDMFFNPISLLVHVLGSVGMTLHYEVADLEAPGNWTRRSPVRSNLSPRIRVAWSCSASTGSFHGSTSRPTGTCLRRSGT